MHMRATNGQKLQRGITIKWEIIRIIEKVWVTYFHDESIYEFQNISIHGSKVMLCTRKRDERTNEQTNERTDQPKAICSPTFFKVGGIKTEKTQEQNNTR